MTIKQLGGVFGRNPTFNNVTIDGELIINGSVFTGLDYEGAWNAATNTPTLTSSVGTLGQFYIVSVAGATDLNGITNWDVGDWALFNGSVWQRVEGGANGNFSTLSVSGLSSLNGGANVTGTVTADGLTVDGDVDIGTASATSSAKVTIQAQGANGSDETALVLRNYSATPFSGYVTQGYEVGTTLIAEVSARRINSSNGELIFRTKKSGTISDALKIDSNGDISFYEDTGTTPKFFWDASAESLALSGTGGLTLNNNGEAFITIRSSDTGNAGIQFGDQSDSVQGAIYQNATDNSLRFNGYNNAEAMRIAASGSVGIGTTSPAELLHLAATAPVFRMEGASRTYQHYVSGTDFYIRDVTAGLNRITLNSSGSVGIGTSSPAAPLSIEGSSTGEYDALILRNSNAAASGQSAAMIFEVSAGTSGTEAASVAKISGLRTGGGAKGDLLFHTTISGVSAEGMRIDSAGHAIIPAGVTLGTAAGVYAAANTLEDYEEGTWTPAFSGGDYTFTYNKQKGSYTRIGNRVFIDCAIYVHPTTAPSGTVDGNLSVTGLPYPHDIQNDVDVVGGVAHFKQLFMSGIETLAARLAGGSAFVFYDTLATNYPELAYAQASDVAANTRIRIQFSYPTNG